MNWLQTLYETYENCAGHELDGEALLLPLSHSSQQAHIEMTLDGSGNFLRAKVLNKENTVIPATEKSANRTSGEAPHPLADKIQYCARDYHAFGGEKEAYFDSYLEQLKQWCDSIYCHSKAKAVLTYVQKGTLIADLVNEHVLHIKDGVLLTDWIAEDPEPEIFKQLTAKKEGDKKIRDQGDAFVRWVVEIPGEECSATWKDASLQEAWCQFYASQQSKIGMCMVSGEQNCVLAEQHPAKLRNGADKAKLISANDSSGYTFRGRFFHAEEAASVGFQVSQKAHNALRWLIARQGFKNGDQVIVSWAVTGKEIPPLCENIWELWGVQNNIIESDEHVVPNTAQAFAAQFNKWLAGYRAQLGPLDDIVVMGIDSATPGRMAITYYRRLKSSEFLERIQSWHIQCAWLQNFSKDQKFVGAPPLRDIAEAAYGKRLDEKLKKATVERLLPCILDGIPLPKDLVDRTIYRVCNRVSLESWEFEKYLGIACSLIRKFYIERSYQMSLELNRKTRDYLYGRLLAVADFIEERALYLGGEKRETTAARYMQQFADRPYSTWRNIELALIPYKSRLRAQRSSFLVKMEKLLDQIMNEFEVNEFIWESRLAGEFLIGYHCQKQSLYQGETTHEKQKTTDTDTQNEKE